MRYGVTAVLALIAVLLVIAHLVTPVPLWVPLLLLCVAVMAGATFSYR